VSLRESLAKDFTCLPLGVMVGGGGGGGYQGYGIKGKRHPLQRGSRYVKLEDLLHERKTALHGGRHEQCGSQKGVVMWRSPKREKV